MAQLPYQKKKIWKSKISGTLSTKEAFAKAKRLSINDFVDDLINVVGSIYLQSAKNQADYKDHILVYYYRLFLIFCDFNQAELNILFSTSLLSFYSKCIKDCKKAFKDIFESTYNQIKCKLITTITIKANLQLETLVKNNYYDKYHLACFDLLAQILLDVY